MKNQGAREHHHHISLQSFAPFTTNEQLNQRLACCVVKSVSVIKVDRPPQALLPGAEPVVVADVDGKKMEDL